jgi:hypothetical protein
MQSNEYKDFQKVTQAEENVNMVRSALGVKENAAYVHSGKILSIHLQSNRPENFVRFLDNLEASVDDLSSFEVIVKIDDNAKEMNLCLEREVAHRAFTIKYIATPLTGGFFGLWSSMNDILLLADPEVYFFVNFNDEMTFQTKSWDSILKKYVGMFPDHVFRLRTSQFRFRNYIDNWECAFAPETSAITTRKWIELGGNWNPCLGPDSFQQCVSYYFNYHERFHRDRYVRDLPINDILIGGEGAGIGLKGEKLERWSRGALKSWYLLMSYKIQLDASRRARTLYAYVYAKNHDIQNFLLVDDTRKKTIRLKSADEKLVHKSFSYKLNRMGILWKNGLRFFSYYYYSGGGNEIFVMNKWACFKLMLAYRFDSMELLKRRLKKHVQRAPFTPDIHIKQIQVSIAWPTYSNVVQKVLTGDFVKQLKNSLLQHTISLDEVESHAGYIVLRLRYPTGISMDDAIQKIRMHSREGYSGKDSPYWINILAQDDYYLYTDKTIEKHALESWKTLSHHAEQAQLIE